jgi:hypothetical protein
MQRILPNLVDNVNNSNIFWGRAFAKPETWEGVAIWSNLTTQNSTTGGSYSGMDEISTQQQNNTIRMTYHPAAYAQPVAIGGLQAAINGTNRGKAIAITTQKMDEAKIAASYNLGTQIYNYGTGKDIDGIGLIDDNGATTSNYGDLSRASYPGVNAGSVVGVTNGIITLDYLSSTGDAISAAGNLESYQTISVMQKPVWTYIEGIIQVMLGARYQTTQTHGYNRISGGVPIGISVPEGDARLGGAAGFESLTYRNRPLVADDQANAQTIYAQNEWWLKGSRLLQSDLANINTNLQVTESPIKGDSMPSVFQWRDFLQSYNQNGKLGILFFAGNYYCTQPRRQGILTSITSN